MDILCDYYEENLTLYSLESGGINADSDEVREELVLCPKEMKKLWGYVKDESGKPVDNKLVTLLLPSYIRGRLQFQPADSAITDEHGLYQFVRPDSDFEKGFDISMQ